MKRKRITDEQIIGVLKEAEAGVKTGDLARRHGISGCILSSPPTCLRVSLTTPTACGRTDDSTCSAWQLIAGGSRGLGKEMVPGVRRARDRYHHHQPHHQLKVR
jgi:hypothetical protein